MKQIPLAIGAFGDGPQRRFANFLPAGNAAALEHLRADTLSAPVYLWGPPGSGKSHLLHALVHERQARGQRCGCFCADDPTPWTLDPGWSLVVLDDCQRFDAAQQQAAFALFVDAVTFGVEVAAAGDVPPVDLPLREDLRTRLGWGHVYALQPLGEAETRAVLRREADRRGVFLSDEVMDHLLTRFARDLAHLMRQLEKLDEYAMVHKRAITVPLLKLMLAEEGGA